MAFNQKRLNLSVDTIAGGAIRIHFYDTTDDEIAVSEPGYFTGARSIGLRAGDVLIIRHRDENDAVIGTTIAQIESIDTDGNGTAALDAAQTREYPTQSSVEAARIPPVVSAIFVFGRAQVGDFGFSVYRRVSSEPGHANKLRSADGAWWEKIGIDNPEIGEATAESPDTADDSTRVATTAYTRDAIPVVPFAATGTSEARSLEQRFTDRIDWRDVGAVGDGVTNDTAAIALALSLGGTFFTGDDGRVFLVDSLTIPMGVTFEGNGAFLGSVTGSRPTYQAMNDAANDAARLALLEGHFDTILTFSGDGVLRGSFKANSILFKGDSLEDVDVQAAALLDACATYKVNLRCGPYGRLDTPQMITVDQNGDLLIGEIGGVLYDPWTIAQWLTRRRA